MLRLPAERGSRGHEQQGRRFAVVVQADELAALSTVIVAPTSRHVRSSSFRPEIEVEGEVTKVMVEQIRAVDAGRLGEVVGHLSAEELWGVDASLVTVLALSLPRSGSFP